MACTDTGLKMCILPAVLTLKPLTKRGKKTPVRTCSSLHHGLHSTNSYCKAAIGALTVKKNEGLEFVSPIFQHPPNKNSKQTPFPV